MRLAVAVGLGFLAAALGTPTGVSGGLLLLPVLLTGYGMSGTVASATNLVFNCVSTPAVLARRSGVDRGLVRLLVVPAAPAAVLGALVNVLLLGDSPAFRLLVALLIVTVGIGLVLPPRRRSLGLGLRGRRLVVVVGAASGLLGGFYGLGGAVLAAPAVLLVTGWPVARVAGAALVTTLCVSLAGLTAYTCLDLLGLTSVTTPDWPLGLALGAGGVAGGWVGARWGARMPDRVLRSGLAVLVTAGAVRLVLSV